MAPRDQLGHKVLMAEKEARGTLDLPDHLDTLALLDTAVAVLSAPLANISILECLEMRKPNMAHQIILLFHATILHWTPKWSQMASTGLILMVAVSVMLLRSHADLWMSSGQLAYNQRKSRIVPSTSSDPWLHTVALPTSLSAAVLTQRHRSLELMDKHSQWQSLQRAYCTRSQ